MRCVVTAGPTYEPLDQVRGLTNISTGRLGSGLAGHLEGVGHDVLLLVGQRATCRPNRARNVETFTTTASLRDRLRALAGTGVGAIFHAAAVGDFAFGAIWQRTPEGGLTEIKAGKLPTRQGELLAELKPTPKILAELRGWFPAARLVGWKYEVEGDRIEVLGLARRQITDCATDACVANGPAYGPGFGLVRRDRDCQHVPDSEALYRALAELLEA